jgi:CRISPR-associated endonuclease/helicase Cas3
MASRNGKPRFIAHVRQGNGECQSLEDHLTSVARLAAGFAGKFNLAPQGELIGLLHDLGKYSEDFQNYIQSATGLLNQDEDEEFVDATGLKGKIDHSTSGAQFIWQELSPKGYLAKVSSQILSLCIASHHSGLIDCISLTAGKPAEDLFTTRMEKADGKTHLQEVLKKADQDLLAKARDLMQRPETLSSFQDWIKKLLEMAPGETPERKASSPVYRQQLGLLVRSLFSCLIDADRIDTSDFERHRHSRHHRQAAYESWDALIERLEDHLSKIEPRHPIDELRQQISSHCLDGSERNKGIYTLTVPTGGGKTLASLRFALHHARKHSLDRIIYVIPFTTIIDQNANDARRILEPEGVERDSVVLEHHSNITPEKQTWRSKILSENWDAPVIFTTSVQLLETLFGSGTRGARRMHQLANAVLIFDEVQSLPVNCVHLFNNAMNYLADFCGSTILLCTATQPLLDQVDQNKGAIRIPQGNELMPDVPTLFDKLKRVEVKNERKPGGWSLEEIRDLAFEQIQTSASCLAIVNTRKMAQELYKACKRHPTATVFHLSTNMCPAHRKAILAAIKSRLQENPVPPTLCISTQLIEAGIDIDFGAVIRLTAGLDAIAQAAGRCNRHGERAIGHVYVVNPRPEDENLAMLPDIRIGRDKAERVLDDYVQDPQRFGNNPIGPEAMRWYYQNYFFERQDIMGYPISRNMLGHDDTLLNLLSNNTHSVNEYKRAQKRAPDIYLRQSFMAAARAFKAIDTPTRGVIVPYRKEGNELIVELCASYLPEKEDKLLRQAQQYAVNVMPNVLESLLKSRAACEVQEGTGILYLVDARYYNECFGLSDTPEGKMEHLHG